MPELQPDTSTERFRVSKIRFRNAEEYAASLRGRADAFTTWYADPSTRRFPAPARWRLNALADCCPEFFLEARTDAGQIAGWRFSIPTRWDSDPASLGTFDSRRASGVGRLAGWSLAAAHIAWSAIPFISPLYRTLARRVRRALIGDCNTMLLGTVLVLPEFRGRGVASLLTEAAIARARQLGFRHLIAALRPTAYGEHKLVRRTGYDPDDFASYCRARREDGTPGDPLLRFHARNGARFLKPEPRSLTFTRSRAVFEAFRQTYKPDCWYEAAPGQWECGVTQSWFVNGDTVTSVEPELWCEIPLR